MTDFYQLTMMNGYFEENIHNDVMVFDMFFRKNPSNGGYTLISGIDEVTDYIENLHFEPDDIEYLRSLNTFSDKFLEYLKDFKFTGEIYAVKEGTVMFPYEPIIRVKAPASALWFSVLYILSTCLYPGFVIFSGDSEIFIFGSYTPFE